MRKLVSVLILGFLFFSCTKDDGCMPNPVDAERAQLISYCTANGINYTVHSNGFLYEIINPGRDTTPTASSIITVNYVGKHFNNSVFDSSIAPYTSLLSNLIDGWKLGLPLIKKGGRLKLVIPSALAYSCGGSKSNGSYVIQPNEPIFFDLTLLDVK
jgi:FKBP-type peptidyl-prolyl cis-trans isomerase FkpA